MFNLASKGQSSGILFNDNKKRKFSDNVPNRDNNKHTKKFKGNYYNYGKVGHRASECRKPKKNTQVKVIEWDILSIGIREMNLSVVVSKCNNAENPR